MAKQSLSTLHVRMIAESFTATEGAGAAASAAGGNADPHLTPGQSELVSMITKYKNKMLDMAEVEGEFRQWIDKNKKQSSGSFKRKKVPLATSLLPRRATP